ncbi:MAG: ABC transporter permease [Ekhidna sp.]
MIPDYFKVTLRRAKKYWLQNLINTFGLSVGFLSVIFIYLFIHHELRYDQFHSKSKTTYRLTDSWGVDARPAIIPPLWAEALKDRFPEVLTFTRIDKRIRFNPLVANGGVKFYEDGFINADSSFFDVFSFKLKSGDSRSALNEPNTILITASKARKYFGNEDALGKTLVLDNSQSYKVTGVLEDLPDQSHLNFNFILPMGDVPDFRWVYSYFVVNEEVNIADFEEKINSFLKSEFEVKYKNQKFDTKFQALEDIHLQSNLEYEFQSNGNISYLYIIASVGLIILIISVFNFINLNVIQAAGRVKELGVRKTLGDEKSQLFWKSLSESIAYCLAAFLLACLFSYALHAPYASLLSRSFNWSSFATSHLLEGLIAAVVVGLLAGIYPALLSSELRPVDALNGNFILRGGKLRNILLMLQLIISSSLIVGTIIIYQQLDLLSNKNLGFDGSQVIAVNGRTAEGLEKHQKTLKSKLEQLPEVDLVSFSQTVPGDYSSMANIAYKFEGILEDRVGVRTIFVSPNFINTLGIEMRMGRVFSDDYVRDSATYIINEACAKMLEWEEDAIGKKMKMSIIDQMEGEVIGVMEDFNFASLHTPIEPLALMIFPPAFQKVLIRIKTSNDVSESLLKISDQWQEVLPNYPFEYQFLDKKFDLLYSADRQFSSAFLIFTIIAIFLTYLGLFISVVFEMKTRLKEVGVRRVIGASVSNIIFVLSKKFLIMMFICTLICIPLSYMVLEEWLLNFAYSVDIKWWVYLVTLFSVLLIFILTTGAKVLQSARVSPVKVLRDD